MYRNEDFLRIIGHISFFFATLDFFVSEVMILLTGRVPFCDTATLGQKFDLLFKLKAGDVTNAGILLDLQVELPRAQAVAKERNRYIHDQWIFDPQLVAAGRIRRLKLVYGPPPQLVKEDFAMSDLEAFLREIGTLQQVFGKALKVLNPTGVTLNGS